MKDRLISFLRFTERFTKTDMVYLASGGFWLTLGQVSSALIALGLAIAFGHFASQDTYGNYKYILSLAGLFAAFSLTGMGTAVTQAVARGFDGSFKEGIRLSLSWSWIMSLVSLCAALFYFLCAHNAFLGFALLIVAVFAPILNSYSFFTSLFLGQKDFARSTLYSFINTFLPALALVITLFFSHRAIVLIIVYFAANAAVDFWCSLAALRSARNVESDPAIASYSKHLSVMGIIGAVADKIDSVIVYALLGPANLAIYTYAIALPEQLKGLVKNVGTLSLPKFATREINEIRATIWTRVAAFAAVVTAAILLYICIAGELFRFLFPVYVSSIPYTRVFVLSILTSAIATPLTSILQAHREVRALYISNNASSIVLIVALPMLISLWGIWGAILSQLLYRATTTIVLVWYFVKLK